MFMNRLALLCLLATSALAAPLVRRGPFPFAEYQGLGIKLKEVVHRLFVQQPDGGPIIAQMQVAAKDLEALAANAAEGGSGSQFLGHWKEQIQALAQAGNQQARDALALFDEVLGKKAAGADLADQREPLLISNPNYVHDADANIHQQPKNPTISTGEEEPGDNPFASDDNVSRLGESEVIDNAKSGVGAPSKLRKVAPFALAGGIAAVGAGAVAVNMAHSNKDSQTESVSPASKRSMNELD